jgi:uncharacterized membrane protein YdbT with pleckstrin-like domain
MALAPCRECGKRVSTEAATCPECGVPNPTGTATATAETMRAAPATGASFAQPQRMTSQEAPVYQAHVHWIIYLRAILIALIGVLLTAVLLYDDIAPYAGIGVLVVAGIMGGIAYVQSKSTEFIITTRRLIAKRGIASRRTIETLLEKVEAVTVEQGPLGRILNFGQVNVIGTGGTNETFSRVSDPMQLRQVIHEQIDRSRA